MTAKQAQTEVRPHCGKVFSPHLLLRICGMPLQQLFELGCRSAAEALDDAARIDAQIDRQRAQISDALAIAIKTCQTVRERRLLLALRRDCFNLRLPKAQAVTQAAAFLDDAARTLLLDYVAGLELAQGLREAAQAAHRVHTTQIHSRLKEILREPALLHAIATTHSRLMAQTLRYLDDTEMPEKVARRSERTLFALASRAATRTQPLSTFASVAYGFHISEACEPIQMAATDVFRRVRVNQALLMEIARRLVAEDAIRNLLLVRVNPTLKHSSGSHWEWIRLLEPQRSRHWSPWDMLTQHHETVRLRKTPTMDAIIERVEQQDGTITVTGLAASLANAGGSMDEANAAVATLLKIGLLDAKFWIADYTDDYLGNLISQLAALPVPRSAVAERALALLRACQANLDTHATARDPVALGQARASLSTLSEILGFEISTLDRVLFYEDAAAYRAPLNISDALLPQGDCVPALLVQLAALCDYSLAVKANLSAMLREYDSPLSLTEAFRRYIEALRKQIAVSVRESGVDPLLLYRFVGTDETWFERVLACRRRIAEHIAEQIRACRCDQLALDVPALLDLLACCSNILRTEGGAAVFYVPVLIGGARFHLLTQIFGGGGKSFSRFLHLFGRQDLRAEGDGPLTGAIRDWNNAVALNSIELTDMPGCFGHTGSTRPVLTSCAIAYPGLVRDTADSEWIELDQLMVDVDFEGVPRLFCAGHKRDLAPCDLGFLHMAALPKLYQFATQISPTISQPSLAILLDEILLSAPGRRTPRLVVGNFILQGRRWLFVTSELKGMLDNLSTFASFERIQDWRRLHGVPACVTVRSALQSDFIVQYAKRSIRPAENGGDADRERESDFAGRPPLFIDFTNVLSLRLFERAVARAMEHVVIEEFLPTAESCPVEIEGRRHLMECVIECRNLLPESAGVQEDDKWNPLPPSL